ncbi:DUF6040 family protein [Oliverpabstia sp. DFI.9.49]|nr:DUF6040 family protein [Blautia sp. DFI.9.9]MCG5647693.1 DUF6040 family protein [Oliverpabstia sp. DFI.9.49]
MIEECQDKICYLTQERDYARTHQKIVEIPVEKPVLYEKCESCDRTAYQNEKAKYETQKERLAGQYKAKTVTCKFFEHIFRHSENIATHSIIAGSDCTNFECFCYCFTTMIFEIKGHSIPNLRFPMVNIINTFGITYN